MLLYILVYTNCLGSQVPLYVCECYNKYIANLRFLILLNTTTSGKSTRFHVHRQRKVAFSVFLFSSNNRSCPSRKLCCSQTSHTNTYASRARSCLFRNVVACVHDKQFKCHTYILQRRARTGLQIAISSGRQSVSAASVAVSVASTKCCCCTPAAFYFS